MERRGKFCDEEGGENGLIVVVDEEKVMELRWKHPVVLVKINGYDNEGIFSLENCTLGINKCGHQTARLSSEYFLVKTKMTI